MADNRVLIITVAFTCLVACDTAQHLNGGCDRQAVVADDGLRLELLIDLTTESEDLAVITETISAVAPAAGSALKLWGEFELISSDHAITTRGREVIACTEDFQAGERVQLTVKYQLPIARPCASGRYCGMGLSRWRDADGPAAEVIGPLSQPYFSNQWLLVPQAQFKWDPRHASNIALEQATLEVITPGEHWLVLGPGALAKKQGPRHLMSLSAPIPLYALSFAASRDLELFTVGQTDSGITIYGASTVTQKELDRQTWSAAVTTIEWMEQQIGPFPFGDKISLTRVNGFGAAMEHVSNVWVGAADTRGAVAHEVVHMWFGNQVRFADWPHFWLAEGFTEWLVNFRLAPLLDPEAGSGAKEVLSGRARVACASESHGPLRFADDRDLLDAPRIDLFYAYGAVVLEQIGQALAREFERDLLALLRRWVTQGSFQGVTTEDLLAFLIEQTGPGSRDFWEEFFKSWVFSEQCGSF